MSLPWGQIDSAHISSSDPYLALELVRHQVSKSRLVSVGDVRGFKDRSPGCSLADLTYQARGLSAF